MVSICTYFYTGLNLIYFKPYIFNLNPKNFPKMLTRNERKVREIKLFRNKPPHPEWFMHECSTLMVHLSFQLTFPKPKQQ